MYIRAYLEMVADLLAMAPGDNRRDHASEGTNVCVDNMRINSNAVTNLVFTCTYFAMDSPYMRQDVVPPPLPQ